MLPERMDITPNIVGGCFGLVDGQRQLLAPRTPHAPRILPLCGSLRKRSSVALSRKRRLAFSIASAPRPAPLTRRACRCPTMPMRAHPKVQELRDLVTWSEGMVWCSPECHGAMTGIMRAQIDWIPLTMGTVRPTQGKTLGGMQVSGGSQCFNAVNQLRILGR